VVGCRISVPVAGSRTHLANSSAANPSVDFLGALDHHDNLACVHELLIVPVEGTSSHLRFFPAKRHRVLLAGSDVLEPRFRRPHLRLRHMSARQCELINRLGRIPALLQRSHGHIEAFLLDDVLALRWVGDAGNLELSLAKSGLTSPTHRWWSRNWFPTKSW
jgi:hypothetical protein